MPTLIAVVGLPGSGKTHHLSELQARGLIAVAYPDYLEDEGMGRLPGLLGSLRTHPRVGVDGQSFRLPDRRRRLQDALEGIGATVSWKFFARDVRGSLCNVIHDGLHSDPGARHGAARMDCILGYGSSYAPPPGVVTLRVQAHEVDGRMVSEFFRKFPGSTRYESVARDILRSP